MSLPFTITQRPVRVTATGFQPLDEVIDIGAFDALDVSLGVLSLEGTTPSVTVELWSSLQNQADSGFVQLYAFPNQSGVFNTYLRGIVLPTDGLLRYLRWKVTTLSGTGGPAATFFIRGLGRSISGLP